MECPPRIEKGVVLVAMRKQISPDPWSLRASHGAGEISRIASEEIDERRLKHRYSRVSDPGGLEPHLGDLAQSASVMQERRLLQDVSCDIATLLQPHGAGAAEMDSDQHARERVLVRRIEHVVVGTRQCGIGTGAGRSC